MKEDVLNIYFYFSISQLPRGNGTGMTGDSKNNYSLQDDINKYELK